jgi:hypothetical protein
MSSELTARAGRSDAELHLVLSDEAGGENALRLTAGGRTVLSLVIRRASRDSSVIDAEIGPVRARLEATGDEAPRIRGTVGDTELPATDAAGLSDLEAILPAVDMSDLSALPLEALIEEMTSRTKDAASDPAWALPADKCKDCNADCFMKYVTCLAGCPDPGTPMGAVCFLKCIIAADKCQKACPCPPAE